MGEEKKRDRFAVNRMGGEERGSEQGEFVVKTKHVGRESAYQKAHYEV